MSNHKCFVCGSEDKDHSQEDHHGFSVTSPAGKPLALVVSTQHIYDDPWRVARFLAFAAAEMAKYFPGKRFAPFTPHTHIINTSDSNTVIFGHSYVTHYITYELPA